MKREDQIREFEAAFRRACVEYHIDAAFVLVKGVDANGSLLMIGGTKEISDYVERCILPNTVEACHAH